MNIFGLKYVLRLKSAKIIFLLAASLFVAKPFLGFSMFSRMHPPAEDNIFVKVFSKRKLEFEEDSNFSYSAIQKKLAEPLQQFIIRFSFLLSILLPAIFAAGTYATNRFLRIIKLSTTPPGDFYLLNSTLII
jgi:hypothetical protein